MTIKVYRITTRISSLEAGRVIIDSMRREKPLVTDIHIIGCTELDGLFVQGTHDGQVVNAVMSPGLWTALVDREVFNHSPNFLMAMRDEHELERLHWRRNWTHEMSPESAS